MKLFGRKKSSEKLREVLRGQDPPAFPKGVFKLLKLLRDPNSELEDLAKALSWDPGLVVRILKLVNSAAFGLARKIDDVQHAVSMMGRAQLEQLVLGVAVKDNLPKTPARGYDAARFWRAAFFRAALARAIADQLHPADNAKSFTGGLLQDMAIPLLAHARPDDYGCVLESWHESPGTELHELERDSLGFSHDEIGAHLGADWELPESLTKMIEVHHATDVTDGELLPAMRLVSVHRETHTEHGIDALVETGRADYGLEPDWTRTAVEFSEQQAGELAHALA